MNKCLVYCSSPLQLTSACNYLRLKKIDSVVLLVNIGFSRRSNNREQMLNIINEFRCFFDDVYVVESRNKYTLELELIKSYLLVRRNSYSEVVCGDYRDYFSQLLYSLSHDKLTLVDDGLVTPYIVDNFLTGKMSIYKNKNFYNIVRYFLYKPLGLKISLKDVFVFSQFPIFTENVSSEFFSDLELIGNNVMYNCVFFFGQKLSESNILSQSKEVDIILRVKDMYISKGLDFTYITHRDDSQEKLENLTGLGVKVKNLNMPAEQYFKKSDVVPEVISSFWSSVLCTIGYVNYEKSGELMVDSIDITAYLDSYPDFEKISFCYQYYSKLGFNVIRFV